MKTRPDPRLVESDQCMKTRPDPRLVTPGLRDAKPHPQGKLTDTVFAQACARLNQIIAIE